MSKQYEADAFIKTGGTDSQYLMANGTTSTGPSGGVDVGTGTANKVAKFSDSDTITDSTITDDGTDVSITGKLGIQTAAPDSLIHIEYEDNNYDVARGIHLDYTKDHTGTGWSAGVFGVRATITHEGTGKTTDVTAGRFQALHEGTGTAYFLYGSSSRGTHNGSGDTGVIWGAFNEGKISGTGTGTHPYLIGTNQKADLNNANASVAYMSGVLSYAKTTAGSVTTRMNAAEFGLDCNQGAATAVDAAVLYLAADISSLTVSGNARTIESVSTLPSVFAGTMETTSFIKTGGTSSQFLKADGSVDSSTYLTGTLPTDFVSAAGGGTFSGDIEADSFIVAGGTSTRFLKGDGTLDANTYMTGSGTSGNIAIFDTTNGLIDNSDFSFNFITSKVTMGGDLDVVGNITTDVIQADGWNYIPQTFQSNFVHTGGNGYMNLPFNSLSDNASGGEQHFIVTPYGGYVHSVAFKNTATGNAMTGTNMNFRVLKNGSTIHTSGSQTFTAAARTYKGWVLSSTDAIFNAGDDLRFQFQCTSGLWQDTCAVVVLKCII